MKKILVVDNDKFILEFMNDVLSERGHEVVTAEGGLSAVDILKTYTPDIIFVDLVMPISKESNYARSFEVCRN